MTGLVCSLCEFVECLIKHTVDLVTYRILFKIYLVSYYILKYHIYIHGLFTENPYSKPFEGHVEFSKHVFSS